MRGESGYYLGMLRKSRWSAKAALVVLLPLALGGSVADDVKRTATAAGERLTLMLPKPIRETEVEESARRGGVTAAFSTLWGSASVAVAELNKSFDETVESVAHGSIEGQELSASDVKVAGRSAKLFEYRLERHNLTYHRWILLIPAKDENKTIMVSTNLTSGSEITTADHLRKCLLALEIEADSPN